MNIFVADSGSAMNAISDDERAAVLRMYSIDCNQGCDACSESGNCAAPTEAAAGSITVH